MHRALTVDVACAQYLSFSDFRKPYRSKEELRERKHAYKLFKLFTTNWFSQFMSFGGRGFDMKKLLPIMKRFVESCRDGDENCILWHQVFHNVVSAGLVNLFDVFLQKGATAGILYAKGYTALHVASIMRREDNVVAISQLRPDLAAPAERE